ncbi:MAG TPA: DUF177 domain-containing protein [Cyanobium sp.]|nr:DUF177 domain-containing protein [Cyanobium sp.]
MSQGERPILPLRPVRLQELRLEAEGLRWEVDQPIADLESLTPVRGWVRAVLHGEALEVEGAAATIVTLCCDRCLQPFNHALEAQVKELLELGAAGLPEERLDPRGSFDPERWLFEQLSLRMPLVNRCGADCPGPDRWVSDASTHDPRWAALTRLRGG